MSPTLSPDLFPRRRLRHWITARGRPSVAWDLAQGDAERRRYLSIQLAAHGSAPPYVPEAAPAARPAIKLVKSRRTA